MGNVTKVTDTYSNITEYIYDKIGNKTATIYSSIDTVTVVYNAVGLPSTVTDWLGNSVDYQYDANGNPIQVQYSNGFQTKFVRDELSRVVSHTNILPNNSILSKDSISYDNIGNIINIDQIKPLDVLFNNQSTGYTHGDDDRPTGISGGTITTNDVGSITSFNANGISAAYSSAENGLVQSLNVNGTLTSLEYDATRALIKKTTNGVEVRNVIDKNSTYSNLLREMDNQNNTIASYIHSDIGLISTIDSNSNTLFYIFDFVGNTIGLLDTAGNVTDTYASDIFGDYPRHVGNSNQPFQYGGQYGTYSLGDKHYHYGARVHNADIGWTAKDAYASSLYSTQQVNKYNFNLNNPLSFVDFDGFKPQSVSTYSSLVGEMKAFDDHPVVQGLAVAGELSQIRHSIYNPVTKQWRGLLTTQLTDKNTVKTKWYNSNFYGNQHITTQKLAKNVHKGLSVVDDVATKVGLVGMLLPVANVVDKCFVTKVGCEEAVVHGVVDYAVDAAIGLATVGATAISTPAGGVATAAGLTAGYIATEDKIKDGVYGGYQSAKKYVKNKAKQAKSWWNGLWN